MKNLFSLFAIFGLLLGLNAVPLPASALTAVSELRSGDLIRGETHTAVYYLGEDGFRYVFPSSTVYFSWYANFDTVQWISDVDLSTIQIGGNVTYKPGSTLGKIDTDPKTYAIDEGGVLRWVTSEAVASSLYGSNWNTKVVDIPDAFFSNYDRGSDIEEANDYNVQQVLAKVASINDDKDLKAPYIVFISDNEYSQTDIMISPDRPVKFVNNGSDVHTATADDLSWGTGSLYTGDHFTRYFRTPGEYDFFCSYHPEMTGTITVE